MTRAQQLDEVAKDRGYLENRLNQLINGIGEIPIANTRLMPYGWRRAAKGRTVWRIVEEVIIQSLERNATKLGFDSVCPAESEVDVYDFRSCHNGNRESYVNIKSAGEDSNRKHKDDISKADKLIDFYQKNPDANLYIATFEIMFNFDMTIGFTRCIVFPTAWIPDIYINPSGNRNLQSSKYKDIQTAIKRTPKEFLNCLKESKKRV